MPGRRFARVPSTTRTGPATTRGLVIGLACYGLAVLFEQLDRPVWNLLSSLGVELVSGHTIKHLWASAGALVLAWAVRRERVDAGR